MAYKWSKNINGAHTDIEKKLMIQRPNHFCSKSCLFILPYTLMLSIRNLIMNNVIFVRSIKEGSLFMLSDSPSA